MVIISKKQKKEDSSLRKAFSKIKEEFNQHLDSINQNTSEINANYEYIMELEAKIEKLNEKISDLNMELSQLKGIEHKNEKKFDKIRLTRTEKEVFLVLYYGEELTFLQIARKLSLTKRLVERHISNIILKGVPIIKSNREGELYLSLDTNFKDQQARENLVGLDYDVSNDVLG